MSLHDKILELYTTGEMLKAEALLETLAEDNELRLEVEMRMQTIREWQEFGKLASWTEPKAGEPLHEKFSRGLEAIRGLGRPSFRLLDVGCYTGWYLKKLVAAFPKMRGFGIDIQPETMKVAQLLADSERMPLKFHYCSLENLTKKYTRKNFDVIVLFDVLEHVLDLDKSLHCIDKVAAHDGLILINLPIKDQDYRDEALEHLRMFSKDECLRLWGHKKDFSYQTCKDELGRDTHFMSYHI